MRGSIAETSIAHEEPIDQNKLADFDADDVLPDSDRRALTIYCREIRAIPPLSREEEVALAKQKEAGETLALRHVLSNDMALRHVLHLGNAVLRNEISIDGLIDDTEEFCSNGNSAAASVRAREEFLRRFKNVCELAAARHYAGELAGNSTEEGAPQTPLGRARMEVYEALRQLRLGRNETDKIADALKAAWNEVQRCDRESPDGSRRLSSIEKSLGITLAELQNDLAAIRQGNAEACQAKNALIESTLRLVVTLARRYRRSGFPLADLVQEGNLGLIRAAEKFDYRLGYRFSTYATWWIRQTIARSIINFGQMIRLPVHLVEARRKLRRTADLLTRGSGQFVPAEKLAEQTNLPVDTVETVMRLPRQPLSLDTPIAISEDKLLEYYVEDRRATKPGDRALQELDFVKARKQLCVLTRRQEIMLRHRFGIEMGRDHTLQEIGDMFAITRERARQIETQALRRLRASATPKRVRASRSFTGLPHALSVNEQGPNPGSSRSGRTSTKRRRKYVCVQLDVSYAAGKNR